MYVVLTTIYPNNPSIADWLGIGPAIRDPAGVVDPVAAPWRRVRVGVRAAPRRARTGAWPIGAPGRRASTADAEPARGRHGSPADDGPSSPARWRRGVPVGRAPATTVAAATAHRRLARRRPSPPRRPRPGARSRGHCRGRRAARPGPRAPASTSSGVIGWFRARLDRGADPARPQRPAPRRGRRPARPARPVDRRGPHRRDDGAAHVPAGRAVPDALRRGLPRADRDRVPPGRGATASPTTSTNGPIRTWPSTRWPAGSSCGARTTSAPRATSACRWWRPTVEPRRVDELAPGEPCRRAPARRDRDRDPDLRPQRPVSSISTVAAAGRHAPWPIDVDRQPAGHRLRRRTARDDRPDPAGRGRRRPRAANRPRS